MPFWAYATATWLAPRATPVAAHAKFHGNSAQIRPAIHCVTASVGKKACLPTAPTRAMVRHCACVFGCATASAT